MTLQLTISCVFKFKSEATPGFQEIISINVLRVINQYHHCASCLSVNDNDSGSLVQTRACDTVCHCILQSMDNASASLNEKNCQAFQWEDDQTDEQFTL